MNNNPDLLTTTSFIKSVLKFSVSSWVNFFISVVSVSVLTRVFSPDVYGNLNIFNSTSSLLVGITCLGLDSSFLRFYNELPEGYDVKQLLAKCMGISIVCLFILIIIVLPFFYREISNALFNKVSLVITSLIFLNTFSLIVLNYFSTCYRMRHDARNYTILGILLQFFSKCFVIIAAVINPNTTTVIVINTMGIFSLTIVYFFIQKNIVLPQKINFSFVGFGEVMKFAILSWPFVIIFYLNTFLSQSLINLKLGSYSLGIYASAGLFIGVLGVIQNGFKTYWAAFMYANYHTERDKIKKVHSYILLFAIVMMGAFIIFQNIFYSLLGEKYQESRNFFTLVLIYPLFQIISETTAYGITIAKKTQYSLIIIIASALTNLIGCYVLLPYIGITGAAVASMLSALVYLALSSIVGQRYYSSICQPSKTVISIIMVLVLAITNCVYIDNYFGEMMIVLGIFIFTAYCFKHELERILFFICCIFR